ncbi:MAG: type ISP restriction/modification enzyme, partial [Anaerolineae bacterium]|nr:type ISP restriction/modification enzyme [Anaerolineae bacterium]
MSTIMTDYGLWPSIPSLFPKSFAGVKVGREDLVLDIDRDRLEQRLGHYFDPALPHDRVYHLAPKAMRSTRQFAAETVREQLQQRGFLPKNIVRYCYRPFDMRWLYWEAEANLLAQPRLSYVQQPFSNNLWLELRRRDKADFDRGYVVHTLADSFGHGVSRFFPLYLTLNHKQFSYFETDGADLHPNLTVKAMVYAKELGVTAPNLFYHLVTVLHTPRYRQENATVLRQDWPHVPLPDRKERLRQSAMLGQKIVMLLNPEIPVTTVTKGKIRPELAAIGLIHTRSIDDEAGKSRYPDPTLTTQWPRQDTGTIDPVQLVQRDYTPAERAALEKGAAAAGLTVDQLDDYLGSHTYDVYLNETTRWANIPARV